MPKKGAGALRRLAGADDLIREHTDCKRADEAGRVQINNAVGCTVP
jgi:hypothetical protein